VDYHRSLWFIVEDSLESFFHFDGKFLSTVRILFTRPGFLTQEFNSGRRVRYSNPLRFYIFASFLSFFITAFVGKFAFVAGPQTAGEVANKSGDAAPNANGVSPERQSEGSSRRDRMSNWIKTVASPQILKSKAFPKELIHLVPEALFICVPLLALLLKVAYIRSNRVYVEHLIFALHIQTFYLLATLVGEVIDLCFRPIINGPVPGLQKIVSLFILYVIYRSFRVVYRQGVAKTLLKASAVGVCYSIIVALALLSTALISALIVSHDSLPVK